MVNGYFPGYGSGAWSQIMTTLGQYGVFTVLLPLVLIFAVVFAILERINLFRNRGVHMLIAMVIGFFTISNPAISIFFMYLFSNLGWAIAILIAVVILIGLAIKPEDKSWKTIFLTIGIALLFAILARPTPWGHSGFRFILGDTLWYWIQMNMPIVIILVILAFCVGAVIMAGKTEAKKRLGEMEVGR